MTNAAVKDAKEVYIATGRLNRNIISKEISISWYKCKLQNLNPKDPFKIIGEKPSINFDIKFLSYVDSTVPQYFDYILVNMSLQKCSSRMTLSNFTDMDTIDDLAIGTNGGYLAYKTQTNQLVSLDEHYLDRLSDFYSYGILISQGEKNLGVLMLLSRDKPNEYDIVKLKEKLNQYYEKSEVMSSEQSVNNLKTQNISQLFAYPEKYVEDFKQTIDKMSNHLLPVLIRGSQGSGKSTLARFLASKSLKLPYVISLNDTPRILQKSYLEYGLSQFETVIIEDLEHAMPEFLGLLTVYTEEFILGKNKDEVNKYKCSKLILTTGYKANDQDEINLSMQVMKQLEKIIERLRLNTVNLVNMNYFADHMEDLIDSILFKNGVKSSDVYRSKLIEYARGKSFKSVQQIIELSIDEAHLDAKMILTNFPTSISESIIELDLFEKEYILKIYDLLDNNMTATANALNIGRSTLYRKLEKYQNDTLKADK